MSGLKQELSLAQGVGLLSTSLLGTGVFAVPALAVQLAAHLGCRRICLLGVDLRYAPESPRFYAEVDPQVEDAFTSVQIWNLSNAGRVLRAEGRELINCSEASLLRPYLPFARFRTSTENPSARPALNTSLAGASAPFTAR